jgi:hypothetical protein
MLWPKQHTTQCQRHFFVECIPGFENPENRPVLIVLDDLTDSAFCKKVSEVFRKGSYNRNISLILFTQNFFNQGPASRGVSLNSKYMTVLHIWPVRCTLKATRPPATDFTVSRLAQSANDLIYLRIKYLRVK